MKLSIIMPCYNVEATLERALESILMQERVPDYEIVIIDDASTDATLKIAHSYAGQYPFIHCLTNERNQGNAHSFYRGLCESEGEYFCVLDGDDYYSVKNKLEKQIAFLDQDTSGEYVAVATHFIVDFGDGNVHVPDRSRISEFTYVDLLTSRHGYFHTATYMYRNIFRGNVPEYFDMKIYRGDTPRTLFHLMYSGKKVKVLDFVGSVYSYTFQGIWSARNEKEHFQYQIDFYREHKKYVRTDFERRYCDQMIDRNTQSLLKVGDDQLHHYPMFSIEECLKEMRKIASTLAFKEKEFILREIYASEYMDTLLASLGYVARINDPHLVQAKANHDVICIFVSHLAPKGGGIFAEVKELAEMFPDKEVYVFQTDEGGISEDAFTALCDGRHVHALTYPADCKEPFRWFSEKVCELAPFRTYYYCSHKDVYAQAIMSAGVCQNVTLFSFDHGFVLGLHNPNIDVIAAKRPVDYALLGRLFESDRLIYLPAWSRKNEDMGNLTYSPFKGHDRLITASGAARFYKVDGEVPYRYLDIVVELLSSLGGMHYYFGPLPESAIAELNSKLDAACVPRERFVHVEWAERLTRCLLENHIDLFIEPFPTVSYKMTLNVLAAGVPIAAWKSIKRMSVTDFVPEDTIFWRDSRELVELLEGLSPEILAGMSANARAYFEEWHDFDIVAQFVRRNKSMAIESRSIPVFADDDIHEMADYLPLVGMQKISVMGRYLAEKKKHEEDARRIKEEWEKAIREEATALMIEVRCVQRRQMALAESECLKKSVSFRIGYIATVPYRVIRRIVLRRVGASPIDRLHGMSAEQFVDAYGEEAALNCIRRIKQSHAYKFGRMVTSPLRRIRRLRKGE